MNTLNKLGMQCEADTAPARRSEVQEQIDNLEAVTVRLSTAADAIEKRFSSSLSSYPSAACDPNKRPSPMCELAQFIAQRVERLESIEDTMNSLVRRCELP